MDPNARLAHEMTNMVVRQTDLSYEQAKERLKKHNGDYMKAIREAHGIPEPKAPQATTQSQERYRQIRGCMDSAAMSYQRTKELQERSKGPSPVQK
jgi:N-acetylmuramic acid 6-phosphate (MurNAc-6-P) etherase